MYHIQKDDVHVTLPPDVLAVVLPRTLLSRYNEAIDFRRFHDFP
jgi:hypothetical protein